MVSLDRARNSGPLHFLRNSVSRMVAGPMAAKETTLRLRVYNYYSKNIDSGKLYTVHHFKDEGIPKSTIYDILKRYNDDLSAE